MPWIYMHKNKINGKVYIGQTIREKASYRWGHNGKRYISNNPNSHFSNAIKKDELKSKLKEISLKKIRNNFINKYKMDIVGIKINDYNEVIHFDNMYSAAQFVNGSVFKIKECIYKKNRRKSTSGYYWLTLEEYNEKQRNNTL